ncbi:uncharacterized protein LOC126886507 [Diabrotica virgifera virgifera]|uniref:THAP-type domain-containing protein n=1 Tax=Diabrotica virgifera virgifera TaxID=50390 RepID=A0ABM5KGU6_DIAVI|nr:uncharacterized protein LOC126880882 [Diabrotica virgifera virgifera]XP_050506269.1 uncharacterized protein LOC126884393 [Diabrotica virgifera virgifera]XP_050509427.1 uncharacterized protein LOC126886507 [Diabrotica virgifera virgifera]
MPLTCIVVNCGSRSKRDKVSFFAIPKPLKFKHAIHLNELTVKRRKKWIRAIRRADLTESKLKYQKVCSKHFIQGQPAKLEDVNDPDWIPTQNMGYSRGPVKRKQDIERLERVKKRSSTKVSQEDNDTFIENENNTVSESNTTAMYEDSTGTETQTELTSDDIEQMAQQLKFANKKIDELTRRINKTILSFESLETDNPKCLYYTGLNFSVLKSVFDRIKPFIPSSSVTVLDPSQQYLLTLMKMRLNLDFKYLAYQFGISQSTCSTYFNTIISIMYQRFKNSIKWPDREIIKKNMPSCFREVFHDKTTIIIDCFEVFIQKPASYLTQQQTWSNYKHHNTVKFLIGITPQGCISYISKAWGGRTSDKQIVELSGFLDKIEPQDIVIADRGFLIKEFLDVLQAKLVIPAFTKGKKQLLPLELEETRNIAQVRIHVERVIGSIKNKFNIFSEPLPISMLTHVTDGINIVDKIIFIACVLINLCPPIVPI